MTQDVFAEKAAQIGTSVQYGGAGGTIIAGLVLNEIGVIIGIIIAISGFIINWYYKHLSYKLAVKRYESELPVAPIGESGDE